MARKNIALNYVALPNGRATRKTSFLENDININQQVTRLIFLSKQNFSKCQILAYIDFIRHRSHVKLVTIKTDALAQGLIEGL